MTTLGQACLIAAAATTIYGIWFAWVNAAVVDTLYSFEDYAPDDEQVQP